MAIRHQVSRRVAVVGAGVAGLVAARELRRAGREVVVFDKARRPGGRTSTRRRGPFAFDHGAQYFTARSAAFRREVARWLRAGVAAPWRGRLVAIEDGALQPVPAEPCRYVGVPTMSTIARELEQGLEVVTDTRVESVRRIDERWHVRAEAGRGLGRFDEVVVALPAPQAAKVLRGVPDLSAALEGVRFRPTIAVMVALDAPWRVPFDGAFVNDADSPLRWIARDSSKPGRGAFECWVLHADAEWSEAHFQDDPERSGAALVGALQELSSVRMPAERHRAVHRWRYAQARPDLDVGALADPERGIVLAGDWAAGSRVEGAFLSGMRAARSLSGESVAESTTAPHPRTAG